MSQVIALVDDDLKAISGSMADLARRHRDTPMVARSNLQQAVPITFGFKMAELLAAIERVTLHDVKAVEYWLKERLAGNDEVQRGTEFIHFACTSEDINNLSYGLMIKEASSTALVWKFSYMLLIPALSVSSLILGFNLIMLMLLLLFVIGVSIGVIVPVFPSSTMPNVADPACKDRSRVMRLAGTVNGKTGRYARILEAEQISFVAIGSVFSRRPSSAAMFFDSTITRTSKSCGVAALPSRIL